jgi:hypothetical protein
VASSVSAPRLPEWVKSVNRIVEEPGVVGHRHGGQGAAEADRQGVHRRAAGDLLDDPHRLQRPAMDIVLETDVAHRRRRVAVRDGETGVPVPDGPFDQAASRGQIHDVVLVDPRWAEQQGNVEDARRLRRVLDEFDQLAAVDHLPRRHRHGATYLVARCIDL